MGESCGGCRISKIVSGDIDGLDGGNGTVLGGSDTFLHTTHISGKSGLVTDSRWDTTQKGRHLRTSLSETENVVNEEKHILTFVITEVFSDGKTSKSDTGTSTRGFVHLTEDKSALGVTVELDDTGFNHFVVQIVTLTSTFTDTTENGVTTVSLGNVVNQFLNQDSLADTSTTEETNLTTTSVGGKKIDDLDTSLENFGSGRLVNELGSFSVNGEELLGLDGTTLINGLTNDVDDTAKDFLTDGNGDGGTSVNDLLATDETWYRRKVENAIKLGFARVVPQKKNQDYLPSVPSIAMVRTVFSPRC
jgi:peptide chain release factor 1